MHAHVLLDYCSSLAQGQSAMGRTSSAGCEMAKCYMVHGYQGTPSGSFSLGTGKGTVSFTQHS